MNNYKLIKTSKRRSKKIVTNKNTAMELLITINLMINNVSFQDEVVLPNSTAVLGLEAWRRSLAMKGLIIKLSTGMPSVLIKDSRAKR